MYFDETVNRLAGIEGVNIKTRDFWIEYMRMNLQRIRNKKPWVYINMKGQPCLCDEMGVWVHSGENLSGEVIDYAKQLFGGD